MASETTQKVLKVLADGTRLHIVEFLSQNCCGKASILEDGGVEGPTAGEVCCHVTGADKITSTVSHHLHELKEAGVVRLERRGKATLCALHSEALREAAHELLAIADGRDCSCSCC